MASRVEEFELRLKEVIAGPAAVATGAMGQLEAAIAKQQASLGGLEGKLESARVKLQTLGAQSGGEALTASIERQKAVIAELESQVESTKATMAGLEDLRVDASSIDAAAAAEANLAAAAEQATEALEAQAEAASDAGNQVTAAAKPAAGNVGELGEAFGKLGGPIGTTGQKVFQLGGGLQKMAAKFGTLGTAAIAASAVAVLALVAIGAGIVSLTSKLIKLADKEDRLGKLQKKLGDAATKLFAGAVQSNVDNFLSKLESVSDVFDENTATGKALAFITKTIFGPLIDMATAAIPIIERLFIQTMILALRAYIAVVKFGRSDIGQGLITGLKIVAVLIGAVIAIAAVGVALIMLPFILAAAAIVALVAVVGYLVNVLTGPLTGAWSAISGAASAAWAAITAAVGAAIDWIAGLPGRLAEIGANMIQSLAAGIMGSAGAVLSAITGAVGGAIDAAKSMLGIASPSRVFASIGQNTAAGMAVGVDQGAPEAEGAMETLVAPPTTGPVAAKAAAKGALGQGGGKVVYIEKLVLGAKEQWGEFRDFLRGDIEIEVLAGDIEEEPA
jgi:peptidoglycan hydrolase CwlO-like protein